MSAEQNTTSIVETGGGETKSASLQSSMLVFGLTLRPMMRAAKRASATRDGRMIVTGSGSTISGANRALIAEEAIPLSAWTSTIGQAKPSSSTSRTSQLEAGKKSLTRLRNAILFVPTATVSERPSDCAKGPVYLGTSLGRRVEPGGYLQNKIQRDALLTNDPQGSAGRLVGSTFGSILEPGAAHGSRKRSRSCRVALAHLLGAHAFGLGHTNEQGNVRSCCLTSSGCRNVRPGRSASVPADCGKLESSSDRFEWLSEQLGNANPGSRHGTALPLGGHRASRVCGTFVLTLGPARLASPVTGSDVACSASI